MNICNIGPQREGSNYQCCETAGFTRVRVVQNESA
jgi:hypothetical protein